MNICRSFKQEIKRCFLIIISLSLTLFHFSAYAQVKNVWALGDGEKVFREDLQHPQKNGNFTWDGNAIHLKGLFNETLAFQVIVESSQNGAKAVELSVDMPVQKSSGKVIGGSTVKYGPEGNVEIFREHYLHVTDSTHPNWFYGSPAARPKKMTGWIPDALIPVNATPGKGGFPIAIEPMQNQGFWIDIQLPRDQQNFPSGIYQGKVRVTEMGKLVKEIPIEINLLPYYLPDENHQTVWLYTEGVYNYFPGLSHQQVDEMLKFEGHRHRVDVVGGFEVNHNPFNPDSMANYKPYLDGTAFSPANGYHGTGEGVGEKLFPVGIYGSPVLGNTKAEVQKQSSLWVDWFKINAPAAKYFWYITDEPPADRYPWIRERSEWIKSNPGSGKNLPVFTTMAYNPELKGVIDDWSGYDGLDLAQLPEIRKQGGDHWFYNGNRPRYGSVILEGSAVDLRVDSWILYKYGINYWFIWQGTHWQHNNQGPKRHLHQNVFNNPLTFINDQMEFGNGDGIIFYPGQMPFFPEQDRGLNEILPSIRLKNIRRGQQDAEIMRMAEQKAGKDKVLGIINKVGPKALSEVKMTDAVPWSEYGDDYDKAREEFLRLLELP